ncbi:unnamed protein product [Clavelina lepadiformis]|uniref:Uncharacterized protein n=1 Tax=Clavelina lepadiformis TaxID=159417 RepID=A0ABP0FSS0_CLALP
MKSEKSRLQTFHNHLSSWPARRICATPRQIANAGMCYLKEHAKWFPLCEFVLQQKGSDYVDRIAFRFSDLRRPILRNPENPNFLSNIQSGPIL